VVGLPLVGRVHRGGEMRASCGVLCRSASMVAQVRRPARRSSQQVGVVASSGGRWTRLERGRFVKVDQDRSVLDQNRT